MNSKCIRASVAAIGLGLICAQAQALPELRLFPYTAQQVGTSSSMSVGLAAQGHTMWYVLTVGGGFSIKQVRYGWKFRRCS